MQQKKTFGTRIREERKRLGLTQQQFADGLELSRSSVALYETDRTVPDLAFALRAKENGIDAWYIMTGERGREAAAHLFDWVLLADIVSRIRSLAAIEQLALTTEKEMAIARLLYKHCSTRGLVDQDIVDDAVRMAA